LHCLEKDTQLELPDADVKILDGAAAIVTMMPRMNCNTFSDYATI